MNSSLEEYYKTIHMMKYHHNYSLTELDEMMPWEKDVFIAMLSASIKKDSD
jgi:hypothetical protein